MKRTISPLRYPGGKASLFSFVENIIKNNNLHGCTYVEPFAGGCGIGIKLLLGNICNKLIINDIDYHIYAFWYSAIFLTDEFCNIISETPITIEEWHRQKHISNNMHDYTIIEVGFSTFFLNRTNRSGILKAGPIGGKYQNGNYKLDCRFNKENLIKRIKTIANYRHQIELYNLDVLELIPVLENRKDELLINFDPPYVEMGSELYLNFYKPEDHVELSNAIANQLKDKKWIITYDNKDLIKECYRNFYQTTINIQYSLQEKRLEKEILIYNNIIFSN